MNRFRERVILALVIVNLALQFFDGAATWAGLHAGFAEGNPILVWAFAHLGPAMALCLFKLQACLCVLVLWHLRSNRLAAPALVVSAAVYAACSLGPWTVALASLGLDL